MKIVTRIEDMRFLFKAKVIGVDIETNTTPPADDPAAGLKQSYGLSYNADIIAIALSDGETTGVLLDVHLYDDKQKRELIKFLEKVLCRDVTLVGHNVVFDLRALGGHYGFLLPIQTKIWDTMVMQRRLLLINTPSAKQFRFSLMNIAKVWGKNFTHDEEKFLEFMKEQRGNISDLLVDDDGGDSESQEIQNDLAADEWLVKKAISDYIASPDYNPKAKDPIPLSAFPPDIQPTVTRLRQKIKDGTWNPKKGPTSFADLDPDHAVWSIVGGFEGRDTKVLAEKSRLALCEYVAWDARLALEICFQQLMFAQRVAKEDFVVPFEGVRMNKWPEILSHIEDWQAQLRINANMAIRGLKVDMNYLSKRIDETLEKSLEMASKLLLEQDSSDPYPMFKEIFSQLIWYASALDLARDEKSHYSIPTKWTNWKRIALGKGMIQSAMIDGDDHQREVWTDWLLSLKPEMTRDAVKKSAPNGVTPPRLDLQLWIRQQCFDDSKIGNYKAFLKTRWLKFLFTTMKKESPIDLVSRLHFRPYFIFAVAGWPLYTSEDLRSELKLGTESFQKRRAELERNRVDFDLQELAIDMDAFACGTKPLEWIFRHLEDEKTGELIEDLPEHLVEAAHKMRFYRELLNNWNTHKRMTEYWYHAQRDGKVHSLLVPNTITGRDGSTLPNLQNIKMKDFAGVFIADDDDTIFLELDYSNAENNAQVMISGDNNFAYDVMVADFHSSQAKLYWSEEWAAAEAAGDSAKLKELRSRSKTYTFARPYGAGIYKAASLLRKSVAEARQVQDRLKARYPMVEQKKAQLKSNCETRVKMGVLPAYTISWHKERFMVDSFNGKVQDYTIINYLAQGGVAVIVHRAMIAVEKYLHEKKYKTYMAHSVHDSIVLALNIWEYYNTNIIQDICEIMSQQVPQELLSKTIPAVAYVTESCPSNAEKWGKRIGKDYPLPLKEFINKWGRWSLDDYPNPDDKKKAPTWKGPVHLGWTLQGAMEEQRLNLKAKSEEAAIAPIAETKKVVHFDPSCWGQDFLKQLGNILATSRFAQDNGKNTPNLNLTEQIKLADMLLGRGVGDLYQQQQTDFKKLRDTLNSMVDELNGVIDDDRQDIL